VGQFDYVMANPPFNVNKIDKANSKATSDSRLGFPSPTTATTSGYKPSTRRLTRTGRAGFVMANSAADAGGSEMEIRKKLLTDKAVDVIVAVGQLLLHRDAPGDTVVL